MRKLYTLFAAASTLVASEQTRLDYLKLIAERPCVIENIGNAERGEIQIVIDPDQMGAIEESTGRDVGVVHRDRYWTWINDAVIFPSGARNVYGRMLWTNSLTAPAGVAICALTENDEVIVLCNYRHASRSWEIEMPRGAIEPDESYALAASREMLEETGMILEDLRPLCTFPPDSGMAGTLSKLYTGRVAQTQDSSPEESEAIERILKVPVSQLKRAIARGYLTVNIRGKETHVPCRDPFLAMALLTLEVD